MVKEWRFLDTGASNGAWNMAVDEAIYIFTKKKNLLPTLRFYQWEPAAISVGYAQNINEGLNSEEYKKLKIDIVRRWTGGDAIFHQDELTYSFVSRIDVFAGFDDLLASYKQVCQGIIKGLSELGISVKFREEKNKVAQAKDLRLPEIVVVAAPFRVRKNKKIPCFMASSKHDLIVDLPAGKQDGKKIVGNAQRRSKEAFLQQGSLPLSCDFALINRLFFRSDGFKDAATSISEISGKKISLKEMKEKLLLGFTDNFSVSFKENSLFPEEINLAKRLFKEKYSSREWTFNRKYVTTN